MPKKLLRRSAIPTSARRRDRSLKPYVAQNAVRGQASYIGMPSWFEEFKKWAPPEWREEMARVEREQRPVNGAVRAPNGVVHDIIGDYTSCDFEWAMDDEWRKTKGDERWVPLGAHAITCFACLEVIP